MEKTLFALLLLGGIYCSHAQTFNLRTVPASDGCVVDKNNDNIADQVIAIMADTKKTNAVLSIKNSAEASARTKAIFEFKVTDELQGKTVSKAVFSPCLNWAYDSEKKQKGKGPELELWGYYGKYADGKVSLNDFNAGKKLNITVKRNCKFKKGRYLELNVTIFVNEALKHKAKYIAFRLDPKKAENRDAKIWTWRSSEFGEKYNKIFIPTLQITCDRAAVNVSAKKTVVKKSFLRCGQKNAFFNIYPESDQSQHKNHHGVLNPRVPFAISETGTGAIKSKAINVQKLKFTYDIAAFIDFKSKVDIDFYLRQSRYPGKRNILEIIGTNGSFILKEAQFANRRWLAMSYGSQEKHIEIYFTPNWKKHKITIKNATILFDDKVVFNIVQQLSPVTLKCMPYAIDQLVIKEKNCEFSLDWEKDYSAQIKTKYRNSQPIIKTYGFDTMVVSLDPKKRDCPYFSVMNNTDKMETVKINYEIHSEINKLKQNYSQTVKLPPFSQKSMAIKLPEQLKTDIYHLKIKSGTFNQYKHFMYAEQRNDKPGEMKFGIHDSGVKDFGYYPDALPIRYAHKYMRWWTEAHPWLRNPNKTWGLKKNSTPDRWYWNAHIDAIVRQPSLIPFICISGAPTVDYQRVEEVGYMKKYTWGKLGGKTDLKRYARYLEQVIKRYKGKVRLWEIENEPNTWKQLLSRPKEYVDRARTVYSVIKKQDPQSTIYGISGTSNWAQWMVKVFKLGGAEYMDGVSYHSYFGNAQPTLLLDFLDDTKNKMPKNFRYKTFNSETGMIQVLRSEVDKPLSQKYVDQQNKLKNPAFVSKSAWPGKSHSEFDAARGMVKNIVINFLAGAKAFTFFAWTTNRPMKNINEAKKPMFSVFSISAKNELTPSLFSLALAVSTTQFEGVTLKSNAYTRIVNYGVTGGIFAKADGGKMAVIWGNQQKSSCVFKTDKPHLEIVNMYGQKRFVDLSKSSNGKYFYTLNLGNAPVYIHSAGDLTVLPSHIESSKSANTSQNAGILTIRLINITNKSQFYTVTAPESKLLKFKEKSQTVKIPPKMRGEVTFNWELLRKDKKLIYEPFILKYGSNKYEVAFAVRLKTFRVIGKTKLKAKDFEVCDIKKFQKTWNIDTVEQAVLGAPPITESIQQNNYWQGRDELSGKVAITYNDEGIIVGLKVKDKYMIIPKKWPSIDGTCVEVFFDFRSKDKKLGNGAYERGVFQFLASPNPGQELFCPQVKLLKSTGIKSYCQLTDKTHYYFGMFIPWTFIEKYGSRQGIFGFDIGFDGIDPKKGKRKTQMMLFGRANNSVNASHFGIIKLK